MLYNIVFSIFSSLDELRRKNDQLKEKDDELREKDSQIKCLSSKLDAYQYVKKQADIDSKCQWKTEIKQKEKITSVEKKTEKIKSQK